jgi:putative flavoprotein involved in K+ transport
MPAPFKKNVLVGGRITHMRRTERHHLIVIGGGQAGLATGHWLAKQDFDFLIVDAAGRIGDSWRKRWDSLSLLTPAKYSSLPGLAFPGQPNRRPVRDEVADYLERYAEVFQLPIRVNVEVRALVPSTSGFMIDVGGTYIEADNVVVATGPYRTPRLPDIAHFIDRDVRQVHSAEYRNPMQLPLGPALVVGAASSGSEIALELAKTRPVTLAGKAARTDALPGTSEPHLLAAGVRRAGRVVAAIDGKPILAGGILLDVESIVWATGFRPDFGWIDAPIFQADGLPIHQRGVTSVPGLYFIGLRLQHGLNSSLIGGVGADAAFIVERIAARHRAGRPTAITKPVQRLQEAV